MNKIQDISQKAIRELLIEQGQLTSTAEVERTAHALESFAQAHAAPPPPRLKNAVLEKIRLLNRQKSSTTNIDLENPPLLDEQVNWLSWAEAAKNIHAPEHYEGVYLHKIRDDEKAEMFVAFVKEIVPEEVHHDLLESFVLLEGACECHIHDEQGNYRVVHMCEGDYIAFQLGETHDIQITSGPAKAILQWLKLAA